MNDEEKLAAVRELAASHSSAHPAYHKHCHLHPDDVCGECKWLTELWNIIGPPMPKRIQLRRTAGWRMPEGAVSVARPTKWGNPFKIGAIVGAVWDCGPIRTIGQALLLYDRWTQGKAITLDHQLLHPFPREHLAELQGKELACWCHLGQPCHADLLLKLANPNS